MNLSWADLEAVICEIRPRLTQATVQKIYFTKPDGLMLIFKGREKKKISLHVGLTTNHAALFLTQRALPKNERQPNFFIHAKNFKGKRLHALDIDPRGRFVWIDFNYAKLALLISSTKPNAFVTDEKDVVKQSVYESKYKIGSNLGEQLDNLPPLKQRPMLLDTTNINDQIEQGYFNGLRDSYVKKIKSFFDKSNKKLKRKINKIEQEIVAANNATDFYTHAELIKTHLFEMDAAANHQEHITIPTKPLPTTIDIPKPMNAKQAMQHLFAKAKKMTRKKQHAEEQLNETRKEIEQTEEILTDLLAQAEDFATALTIYDQLGGKNQRQTKKEQTSVAGIIEKESPDGYRVLIGRHAAGNEKILKIAKGNDLWLHVRGFAGSHCLIVRRGKQDIPQTTIKWAAQHALKHSKAKNQKGAEVEVALRGDIKRTKNGKPGQVNVVRSKTIYVEAT